MPKIDKSRVKMPRQVFIKVREWRSASARYHRESSDRIIAVINLHLSIARKTREDRWDITLCDGSKVLRLDESNNRSTV